jgi:hypothetical protein
MVEAGAGCYVRARDLCAAHCALAAGT